MRKRRRRKSEWQAIGPSEISTDDFQWFESGIEASGAYYRIAHLSRDTHPFYAESCVPQEYEEERHRAKVMFRLLGDRHPGWSKAIRQREIRRRRKRV